MTELRLCKGAEDTEVGRWSFPKEAHSMAGKPRDAEPGCGMCLKVKIKGTCPGREWANPGALIK